MGTSFSEGEGDYLMPERGVLNWNRLQLFAPLEHSFFPLSILCSLTGDRSTRLFSFIRRERRQLADLSNRLRKRSPLIQFDAVQPREPLVRECPWVGNDRNLSFPTLIAFCFWLYAFNLEMARIKSTTFSLAININARNYSRYVFHSSVKI